MTGAGEPPMPGMSNRMTGRLGSRASANGCSSSRLTPMPLHSSSGGQPGAPGRTDPRMARPPTLRILICSAGPPRCGRLRTGPGPGPALPSPAGPGPGWSVVIDVCARGITSRLESGAAGLRGRGPLIPAALGQPARVVRPPGPVTGLGLAQPFLRVLRAVPGYLVPRLVVARRVDHRGDVPAGGQHEPLLAGEQLSGPVAALPGADVVGNPGDDIGIAVDGGQVQRRSEHGRGAGPDQRVGRAQPEEVPVQAGGHPGGVRVPEQDVERRGLPAEQVVVDPVVPDQVVGTQPG